MVLFFLNPLSLKKHLLIGNYSIIGAFFLFHSYSLLYDRGKKIRPECTYAHCTSYVTTWGHFGLGFLTNFKMITIARFWFVILNDISFIGNCLDVCLDVW